MSRIPQMRLQLMLPSAAGVGMSVMLVTGSGELTVG